MTAHNTIRHAGIFWIVDTRPVRHDDYAHITRIIRCRRGVRHTEVVWSPSADHAAVTHAEELAFIGQR